MQNRAYNLDALRGTAILLMVLSGIIPRTLPHWMFHAQVPPGLGFNPLLPGITWVDLVFPFFLFCLGAALPFALGRRMDEPKPLWPLVSHVLERTVLLVFFAIFVAHIRPYAITTKSWATQTDYLAWFLGIAGFIMLFMIYIRSPKTWPKWLRIGLKIGGFTLAILFLALIKYPSGEGFKPERMDIIIMLLANMVFFGSIIYILTRKNPLARFVIMAVFIAMRLVHMQWDISLAINGQEAAKNIPYVMHLFNGVEYSWMDKVWDWSPLRWLYNFSWLKYLLIVIPGTIAGDQIKEWLNNRDKPTQSYDSKYLIILSLYAIMIVIIALVGLYTRMLFLTTLGISVLCFLAWFQVKNPKNSDESFLKKLILWGSAWLILGLMFEPFGGGIKKDNSTLSYYLLMVGLAYYMLMFYTVWVDILQKRGFFGLLINNGQNPMIAYVAMGNLIIPLFYMTRIFPWLKDLCAPYPWLGFAIALVQTLLLAWFTSYFTKKKLFWRT